MREAAFVKENREKWENIEADNSSKNTSAEVLAENFIEITEDLSYARTFYPKSQTIKYLNRIASRYFIDINRFKRTDKGKFIRFWKEDLPNVMYACRKHMLYSFIFLFAGMLLGIFSLEQDADFANLILGEHYMSITKANIAKGDPMAIYKSQAETPMFLGIATNNIRVAFIAFIYGIFISIGTVRVLFANGVMLGVFQYLFYKEGILGTAMLSIWLHGTLEISAIVIAGGAGLVIGNSILFPGSYKRSESLVRAAKKAIKIIIGLIPVFLVAAFIESYLTRLTEMPIIFNLLIIGASAFFIGWYFFYYPYKLNKNKKI